MEYYTPSQHKADGESMRMCVHVYCYNSVHRVGHSDELVSGIHWDTVFSLGPGCVSVGKPASPYS